MSVLEHPFDDGHCTVQGMDSKARPAGEALTDEPLSVPQEIIGRQIADRPLRTEAVCEAIQHAAAVFELPGRHLAGLDLPELVGQEVVAGALDGQPAPGYICIWSRLPSCVKVRGHTKVVLQGGLGILPDAEEVDLPADFLAPLAVVVGGQGKGRVGL